MYIKLCDRCGRATKRNVSFLLPIPDQKSQDFTYSFQGIKFSDDGVTLCNNCHADFLKFLVYPQKFNNKIVEEDI